jgi:hypothetical protein
MPLTSGAKDTSYATWALTGQHADWALTRSWRLPGSDSSSVIARDDDSSPSQMRLRVHWKEDSTYDSYEVAPPLLGHRSIAGNSNPRRRAPAEVSLRATDVPRVL